MWQAGDGLVRDERMIGKPPGRPASFEGLHVVPLIAIGAKTLLSPPITYWEKFPSQTRSRDQTRENSVWQNLSFTLNLRKNKANGFRWISLFCEPSPPLGIAPEFMEITWSFKGAQVVLTRVTERFVNLRISSMGVRRIGPSISPPELRHKWTVIPDNLRNALRKTDGAGGLGVAQKIDGVMDLRVVLEREADIEVLKSFFAETELEESGSLPTGDLPMGDYWRPNYDEQKADTRRRFSNSSIPTGPRVMRRESIITRSQTSHQPETSSRPSASSSEATVSAERRPQTNPHLDPNVYDPFPGMPVAGPLSASRTTASPTSTSSPASSTSASPTPAETSQALAELQLSDGEGPTNFRGSEGEEEEDKQQADSDSSSSSSSAWSFLAKSKKQNLAARESSSSSPSSSSSESSPSPPSPPPPPPRRIPRPIVVNSESESSDVEIVSVRENIETDGKRKKKRKSGGVQDRKERKGQEGEKAKRKKRKRREVAESSGAEDASTAAPEDHGQEEMEEDGGEEQAEAERKKRRKERRKKKRTIDLDNDGDVEMASDEGGRSTKKKKKSKHKADSESATPAPSTTKSTAGKKGKKGKSKVSQLQSESEGPLSRPKSSGSLKRKHFSSDGVDNDESGNEEVDVKRERLKRRITEINLQKHELRVEEEEIKAMLHRLDFDSRRLDDAGIYRAHCVCSACGKYGHRKNSSICELYSSRRWR